MTTPAAPVTPTTPVAPVTPPAAGAPAPVADAGAAGATPSVPPVAAPVGGVTPPEGQGTQTQPGAGGDPKTGAPADYELKAPEGTQVPPENLKAFATDAKAMGLSAEQAQKLVEYQSKASAAAQAANDAAWAQTQKEWDASIRADAELGGAAFEANRDIATKALARFGTPKLAQELGRIGYGQAPEFQRLLLRVGKAIAEDSVAGATGGSTTDANKPTPTQLLYPTHFAPKKE